MNELLTLGIAPLILWALLAFFRVPASTLFLSILTGKLFSEELSQKLYDGLKGIVHINDLSQLKLGLLLTPVILTILLTQRKAPKTKIFLNAIPLLFASVSLLLFVLPLTKLDSRLSSSSLDIISSYQAYIICAAAGITLVSAWLPHLKRGGKHKT